MLYNYHTHTTRCNHALGTDREYVEAAISAGLKQLGFSDHSPILFPESAGGHYSGFRMRPEAYDEYAGSVLALREEFKDRIQIFLGVEIEYFPDSFDRTERFLKDRGIDFMILGQHFTRNEYDEGAVYVPAPHLNEEQVLVEYTDAVVKCIDSEKFLYIAHPDVALFNGDNAFYRDQAFRICEAALRRNVPLEVNLGGYRGGRRYPALEFWKVAGETGAPVVFGIDAHRPDDFIGLDDLISAFRGETADYGLIYVEEPLL